MRQADSPVIETPPPPRLCPKSFSHQAWFFGSLSGSNTPAAHGDKESDSPSLRVLMNPSTINSHGGLSGNTTLSKIHGRCLSSRAAALSQHVYRWHQQIRSSWRGETSTAMTSPGWRCPRKAPRFDLPPQGLNRLVAGRYSGTQLSSIPQEGRRADYRTFLCRDVSGAYSSCTPKPDQ